MPRFIVFACSLMICTATLAEQHAAVLWDGDAVHARLVAPKLPAPTDKLIENTINGYLQAACGRILPTDAGTARVRILVGNAENNPAIAEIAKKAPILKQAELGDEGYQILTFMDDVIVTANTPAGLKYGCQELMYFHTSLTDKSASIDWPLNIVRKPAFPYRGVYILPCWSAEDSLESWERVLRFDSELTINRNWFWLGGFPLMAKYGGEYKATALANVDNVRGLVDLCRAEAMKFYIGDGWFTWHHAKAANGSMERGIQYYLDLMDLLPGADGIYLEPVGEGSGADEKVWRQHAEGIKTLAKRVWAKRPDYEFALAIGKFNAPEYRKLIHEIDDTRMYWWWCWGDPIKQNALAEHPLVLRWHIISPWTDYHGSGSPPKSEETALKGFATSYDPGQGYGNPWNGWAKMGYDKPRNFHPYTMPYFAHQYEFRERCWDVNLTHEQFWMKMARRLFDADMPAESIQRYRALDAMCFDPAKADPQKLAAIDAFVKSHADHGTARNRDTLMRMRGAVDGVTRELKNAATKPAK